ncbi:sugar phosphate isomerase/epimerase [candidate division WOR-3 bacterium]|nr:sugar phosphate isomerase/epimerase [candidate division WOR-3 bacterium]
MKLSISTTLFYGDHIFDVLLALKGLSFDGLELRLKEPHFDHNEDREIKELGKRAKSAKIKIYSLHAPSGIDLSSVNEWDRVRSVREVEKAVVIANRIGADYVIIHPGEGRSEGEKQLRMFKNSMDEIVEFAEDWGTLILIENTLPGRIGDTPEEIVTILKMYEKSNIGFCLDTSHLNLLGLKMSDIIEPLGNYIKEVHVSDNQGKKDDHTLPYEGNVDWEDFLKGLKDIRFDGTLCFELMPEADYIPVVKKIGEIYRTWEKVLTNEV